MEFIEKEVLEDSLSYAEYRALVRQLLAEGKSTGLKQSDSLLEYTRLNEQRMNRIEKTFHPEESVAAQLRQIDQPVLWLVITEGWCGDAAQIVPVLERLAAGNPLIQLRFILRDENLPTMDAFLTNGGRSIPKLIFIDPESRRVLGSWGPRPAEMQAMMMAAKAEMSALADNPEARKARNQEAQTALHSWYARDRTVTIQREVATAARQSSTGGIPVQVG